MSDYIVPDGIDPALYWAGRMAIQAERLSQRRDALLDAVSVIDELSNALIEYDQEILSRMKSKESE